MNYEERIKLIESRLDEIEEMLGAVLENKTEKLRKIQPEREFEKFWANYPRKVSKGAARKAWAKLRPDRVLVKRIFEALEYQQETGGILNKHNREDGADYRPHPATWLNNERWLDENDETAVDPTDRFAGVTYEADEDDPLLKEFFAQQKKNIESQQQEKGGITDGLLQEPTSNTSKTDK